MPRVPKAIIASLLLLSGASQAADLQTAGSGGVAEVAHRVEVRVRQGVAHYAVLRRFINRGRRTRRLSSMLTLPHLGAVTSLRLSSGPKRINARLVEAKQALSTYRRGPRKSTPRRHLPGALLRFAGDGYALLTVFPVRPGQSITVHYTVVASTRQRGRREVFLYPGRREKSPAARLHLPSAKGVVIAGLQRKVAPGGIRLAMTEPAADVSSDLWLPAGKEKLKVKVRLQHPDHQDLRITLHPPDRAKSYTLFEGSAGSGLLDKTFKITPQGVYTMGHWQLSVRDGRAGARGALLGWSLGTMRPFWRQRLHASSQGQPRGIPDPLPSMAEPHRQLPISLLRLDAAWQHTLSAIPLGKTGHALRLQVAAPTRLSTLPKSAHLAFLLDLSHSQGKKGLERQLTLLRATASQLPHARMLLFGYARALIPLSSAPIQASRVGTVLRSLQNKGLLRLRNGSALGRALRETSKRLASLSGAKRLIAFTDDRLRQTFSASRATAALTALGGDGALHLIIPSSGTGTLHTTRLDTHRLSPLAKRGGGLLLEVADLESAAQRPLAKLALSLLRPTCIDNLRVEGLVKKAGSSAPSRLPEGDGFVLSRFDVKRPQQLVLRGQLWQEPLRKVILVNPTPQPLAAALLSADPDAPSLPREQRMALAMAGSALSRDTSFVIPPPRRPTLATHGSGSSATGGTIGCRGTLRPPTLRQRPSLRPLALKVLQRCRRKFTMPRRFHFELMVELTRHEIVDVRGQKAQTALERCVVEGIWNLALPRSFDSISQIVRTVTLP